MDLNQNLDKLELGSGDRGTNSPNLRVSPQPYTGDGTSDQSNSEDSSLSDSDRTLVGDAPGNNSLQQQDIFPAIKNSIHTYIR